MIYDEAFFDAPLDRTCGDSIKWTQYGADVIPLWIADMDFRACEEITQALVRRAQEGCYGYARDSEAAIEAMIAYHREHVHWEIEREWVVPQPGVVTSLNLFCKLLHETRPERSDVLIGEPVYHHFMSAAELQHIRERRIQLAFRGNPLAGFDPAQAAGAGGWLFCNPENPLGHLWSPEELRAVLAVAKQHDLLVASDEIHGGLVLDAPYTYTPMMALAKDDAERSRLMAFVAPSKTFNIPGLGCAFAIIPDPQLRAHFTRDYDQIVPAVNLFGWVGAEAAYRYGEPWRLGMLAYLRKNRALLEAAAAQWQLPLCRLDATYLAFLDGSSLLPRLKPGETLKAHFLRYGVAIHEGALFGAPGWIRLNIATQHATLRQALERMDEAIGALRA
ncbi:MAG: MalY/PatB family protein [Candidatus Spyradenecus sp.]